MYATKQRVVVELDENVNDRISNNEVKVRNHPGLVRTTNLDLPVNLKNAILGVLGGTSKKDLIKQSQSFARYLKSRNPPVEKNILNSKVSAIKQEVEESLNVDQEALSEEQLEHFTNVVQFNTYNILKQRIYNWQPIIFTHYTGLQYLFARAAAEYAVISQIFNEIKVRENFMPSTLFDFGSGVGTVVWAANETWGNSLKEIFCVDTSRDMINLSENLIGSYQKELKNKLSYRQFLPIHPNYDVVVSAYSLMELPSTVSRLETLAKLWCKTNKYLILIEQGTTSGFKIISEARQFILEAIKDEKTNDKSHIFSPCPHDLDCPKLSRAGQNPCHFQVSYNSYPQKQQLKNELYSYVVISKEARKSDDKQWPRIVRPVLYRSRHVICRMCTGSGTLEEIIFSPAKHGSVPYRCAKSCKWGDRLPINIRHITEESQPSLIDPLEN
ncbi:ribosome assembly protein METTL17, mitochondrial isoform X2 [Rhodnius prolixus]|uniref:ribosome assembly protein METTL17, mitochondrial isoform X2 n=1 Tax=Rhodnius prolixus TaxID=13249 RepID=UPI003D18C4EE